MAQTADDYLAQLLALLPQGSIWTRDPTSNMGRTLRALAAGLARVDARGDRLVEEADPRTTLELLSDWERVAGLPDPCLGSAPTIQQRRASLVAKLTGLGGQSPAYFQAVAAALGFTVSIVEFRQFRVNKSRVGDRLYGPDWRFTWRVVAPLNTIHYFRVGQSAVGEPLRVWGNDVLECVIRDLAPAHTIVQFAYQ